MIMGVVWWAFDVVWGSVAACSAIGAALPPLALLTAAAAFASRRPRGPSPPPHPARCIAHRGAALDAPENTLAAFKHCINSGCKCIEFDLRITRDGKCVLCHDASVAGRTIADTDWTDLKDINVGAGHPMSQKFGSSSLCLFEEAVELLTKNQIKMIIEVKVADRRIYTSIIEAFKKYPNMYDTTIVTSFNPFAIYKLRYMDLQIVGALNYHPRIFSSFSYNTTGPHLKRYPNSTLMHTGARMIDKLYSIVWSTKILPYWTGSSAVILHKDIASLNVVENWRKSNYSVFTWGVNQPIEKHYSEKVLGVPYITDTLVGEPTIHKEINGKIY